MRSPVPDPVVPTAEQENNAIPQLPCVPGRLVYCRLALFAIDAPEPVPALIVALTVTVTDCPASRQETFTVTSCPTVELLAEKAVAPAQVAPCVLETFTAPIVRLASNVSVMTTSNAVVALFPFALLLVVSV